MKNVFSNGNPVLHPCESNYSFIFDFVANEMTGQTAPLYRICTLMRKMKVKCFTKEELEHDLEIKEELTAIALRADRPVQASAIRYAFFQNDAGKWVMERFGRQRYFRLCSTA